MRVEKIAPADMLRTIGSNHFREAYKENKTLSSWLEERMPYGEYKDGFDAFERLMFLASIRTQSVPEYGIFADEFDKFNTSDQTRALAMEWIARRWRAAATGVDPSTRSLYLSGETVPSSAMNPYVQAARVRMKQIQPAIPLSSLVAMTTSIDAATYQAFYLTDDTDAARMKRVAEGAEVPRSILKGSEHVIRLKKYGRALEMSYEQLRRQQIDMVSLHIARMAIQAESDKVDSALAVLIAGDGNPNTAATVHAQTALHPGSAAGTPTLDAWLAFKLKFTNPYMMSTILAQEGPILRLLLLNVGNANVPLVQIQGQLNFGSLTPINPELGREVGYGVTAGAPALKVVGFDSRLALEHIMEIGANIAEVERFVSRQTQALVMTETEGFAIFDQFATKVYDINA
jgi:hypothetical protein